MDGINLNRLAVLSIGGAVGGALAYLFGGWGDDIITLLIFMAVDFITGLIVAGVFKKSSKTENGALESRAGLKGLCRKGGILLIVIVANQLDRVIGTDYVRTAVIVAFIINESISICESARLEGLGVTYPDTDAIFNGMSAPGVKVNDIIAVNNLKRAWQFLLDTLEPPLDYAYICKLNQIVGGDNLVYNAGYIRKIPVSIGGTSCKPDIPNEESIKCELSDALNTENATERAIEIMLFCMRGQFFLDGNKRTAMLAANKEMIANGQGIITIPVELIPEFTPLLVKFYETGNNQAIKDFIYNNCIDGLNL